MNVILFESLYTVWFIIFAFTETIYTYMYLNAGSIVSVRSFFTSCLTKKYFILTSLRLIALVVIWWYTGAFSNLDFVINGMKVRRIMLEDSFGIIPVGRAISGVLMVTWTMANSSMLSGWDKREEGKPVSDLNSSMKK